MEMVHSIEVSVMDGAIRSIVRYGILLIVLFCAVSALDFGYETLLTDENEEPPQNLLPVDKRYARLSYFRQPKSRSRYRWGYRRSRYSHSRNPWDYLPDTYCFRKSCRSRYNCCKRYSICEPVAKICYDCWYGHPCSKSSDCCLRYPKCSSGMCTD